MLKTENDSIKSMSRQDIRIEIMILRPDMSESSAHRLAGILKRASQRRDLGFEEGLRILGILPDPTAHEAVRNLEGTRS